MKYLIHIILLFLILGELEGQSISLYPKKGKKIKIDKNFSLGNGSIIIKDNNLISKVLPLKNLKKIKYSQKSYKPIGDIFWFVGQFILGSSLVPAVIGDPEMFYKYAGVGSALSIGGFALNKIGKSDIELVINLQGDEPLMNIDDIRNLYNQMTASKLKLGTLASNILDENFYINQNIVKVITREGLDDSKFPGAINFMRKSINTNKNTYHHLGIYCYRLETLEKFVSLNQSQNEIENKLEQLRALDNKIEINVALAKASPLGVDTEEDYVAIKKIMEYKS